MHKPGHGKSYRYLVNGYSFVTTHLKMRQHLKRSQFKIMQIIKQYYCRKVWFHFWYLIDQYWVVLHRKPLVCYDQFKMAGYNLNSHTTYCNWSVSSYIYILIFLLTFIPIPMPISLSTSMRTSISISAFVSVCISILYKLRSVQNTGTCYPGQGWFVRNLGWGR